MKRKTKQRTPMIRVGSQSAMEYLMTYGWTILIISVVLASLWSLGVFSAPGGGSSGSCGGVVGYVCGNPVLMSNGILSVSIGQVSSAGRALTVTGTACSNSTTQPSTFSPASLTLSYDQQTSASFVCHLPTNTVGTTFFGMLWIQYNYGTQTGLVSKVGQVQTKVTYATSVAAPPPNTYAFSATAGTGGTISCSPVPCSGTYAAGNTITLTETPIGTNTFNSWSGTSCSGTSSSCILTMPASADSEAANFNILCSLTITSNALYTSPIAATVSFTIYGGGGGGGGGSGACCGQGSTGATGSNGATSNSIYWGPLVLSPGSVVNVIIGGGGGGGGGESNGACGGTCLSGGGGGSGYYGGGGGAAGSTGSPSQTASGGGGGGSSIIFVNGLEEGYAAGGAGGTGANGQICAGGGGSDSGGGSAGNCPSGTYWGGAGGLSTGGNGAIAQYSSNTYPGGGGGSYSTGGTGGSGSSYGNGGGGGGYGGGGGGGGNLVNSGGSGGSNGSSGVSTSGTGGTGGSTGTGGGSLTLSAGSGGAGGSVTLTWTGPSACIP